MNNNFLLYGSTGYTGDLIARRAITRGLEPVLAGRNPDKLAAQAKALELPYRVIALEDTPALESALAKAPLVLHIAGPYTYTAAPMVEACLRLGVHYLDITGEIQVYQAHQARDAQAREKGVMILSGVGFDVVPTDCLALHLKNRLPSATHLRLAIRYYGPAGASRGTLLSGAEFMSLGALARRDGQLIHVERQTQTFDFGHGPEPASLTTWGDLVTAYHSTGIPNIEDYMALNPRLARLLNLSDWLGGRIGWKRIKPLLRKSINMMPSGSKPEARASSHVAVWGEASDGSAFARARLHTPEAYDLTAITTVAAVEKVLAGMAKPGFQTPASAFGADFILEAEGVQREDIH